MKQGIRILFKYFDDGRILTDEERVKKIDAIEEVLFIGYPAGLWDSSNYLPIVRKGITATPEYIDYDGEKKFLIDASVFPGSSGSPVILHDTSGTYVDRSQKIVNIGVRFFSSAFFPRSTDCKIQVRS